MYVLLLLEFPFFGEGREGELYIFPFLPFIISKRYSKWLPCLYWIVMDVIILPIFLDISPPITEIPRSILNSRYFNIFCALVSYTHVYWYYPRNPLSFLLYLYDRVPSHPFRKQTVQYFKAISPPFTEYMLEYINFNPPPLDHESIFKLSFRAG